MKEAMNYNGYALVDILQPCVSFNKVNTWAWYNQRVYNLDEDKDYNPTNKLQAFEKALEWGDKIPLGVIYREDRLSYTDKVPFLKERTLVDSPVKQDVIEGFFKEFM